MRDTDRIDVVLGALRRAWHQNPDLRLTQLIYAAAGQVHPLKPQPGLFYVEDSDLLPVLRELAATPPPTEVEPARSDLKRAMQLTAGGWDYRVFVRSPHGEDEYVIREAWFDGAGNVTGWTEDSAPYGTTLDELRRDLAGMAEALDKPIVRVPKPEDESHA